MTDSLASRGQLDCQPAASKRRRWSLAEKLAVIAEAYAPATNASAIARRHGIRPVQLYRWKRSLASLTDLGPRRQHRDHVASNAHLELGSESLGLGAIVEVQLPNGRSIRIHGGIDPSTLSQLVAALSG